MKDRCVIGGGSIRAAVLVCMAALPIAACAPPSPGVEPFAVGEGEFPNHDPDVRYVGREACASCHPGNHANFVRTGMGRSFYEMRTAPVVEDYNVDNEFVDPATGLRYRMTMRDGKFYQRQFLVDEQGRELAVDERELVYAVGSNNHSRGYITVQEDKLFQAPVCWDPTEEFWMFCPGFEFKNDHFAREASYSCLFCHNGRMELVEGERNQYQKVTLGIGCERCHGPGELHVSHQRELATHGEWTDPAQPDPTIVNPSRLPRRERIEVCFQCHLGDTSATVRVVRHDRTLASFRPGERITDVLVPFRFVEQTRHDFGIVSQADRMILSRCYTESGGELECLTCHNPHITVYERPPGSFRDNCLICHQTNACGAQTDAREATEPPDDCVACHMRSGEPVDRRYAQFTDHWIRRTLPTERDRRTNFEMEPVFPEVFALYPPGEQAYYRARANFLRADESPPNVRAMLLERAEASFVEAIERGFDNAEARFFLGKTYMFNGRWAEAAAALERALEWDPAHRDARFALGQVQGVLGDNERAAEIFAGMIEEDPENTMAQAEYGRAMWTLGHHPEAVGAYRRAIDQEPWNASLHLNLANTLASVDRLDEAGDSAAEAIRLDPDSVEAWEFLAHLMRAAGREREASQALARLRQLKGVSRPPG